MWEAWEAWRGVVGLGSSRIDEHTLESVAWREEHAWMMRMEGAMERWVGKARVWRRVRLTLWRAGARREEQMEEVWATWRRSAGRLHKRRLRRLGKWMRCERWGHSVH